MARPMRRPLSRSWIPAAVAPSPHSLGVCRIPRRLCRSSHRGGARSPRFASLAAPRAAYAESCRCAVLSNRRQCLRCVLPARCRRQAARRGLRPGRPHQYLRDRCRRLDHHAADRLGAGARPHPGGARRRDHRPTAQRLYPRTFGGGRDRSLPAVLHPRRGRRPGPVSLRSQHDASRARSPSPAASRRAPGATASRSPTPMLPGRRATSCRPARRSAPAIPSWSANAGSDQSGIRRFGVTSDAWQRSRGCAARRYRHWSCRSSPVRRSESRAARRNRRRPRHRAAWP